jgi:hypothetical protein
MGGWTLESNGQKTDLSLEQSFQKISGTVALGAVHGGLRDARLRGASISFAFVDVDGVRRDYTGRVTGSHMEGSFRDDKGQEGRWTASKK